MSMGTNTREYRLFVNNSATLAAGIQDNLPQVAYCAFAENLISQSNAEEAQNPFTPKYSRASQLLQILLTKIQRDSKDFYAIMKIFWEIPALQRLTTILDPNYSGPAPSSRLPGTGTGADRLLDIRDKRAVVGALSTLATEWEAIGLMLEIKDHDLQTIKKDNEGCKAQLLAMISFWLNGKGGERSWSFLCAALRDPLVGRPSVAEEIERQRVVTSYLENLFCQACQENIATIICVQCSPPSGFKFCESCSSKEHDRLPVKIHKPEKIGNVTASETYIGAYREILATQDCVELWFIKVILLGPPGLGKTTLRHRLTGKMENIGSSNAVQPSTGVIDSRDNIFVRNISNTTAIVTSAQWSATEDLEDVISTFIQFIPTNINSATGSAPSASKPVEPESVPSSPRNTRQFKEVADMIRQAVSPEMYKSITMSCTDTAFLNMEDTGGQPEFMDLLPALTIGPALYLLFCNLAAKHGLQSCYPVSFRDKSGENIASSLSAYTMKEVLLNALASISCFQSLHLEGATMETSGASAAIDDLLTSCNKCKSLAYIVGTHRDLVSEKEVDEFDEELKQSICSTDFFEEGLVLYSSADRMVLPIDNMKGGEDEIKAVQQLLEKSMKKHFEKLKIPASWLVLSLVLRKREQRTASLDSVLQLARGLGISDERETKLALWFLHHYAGVLMYFPAVPELRDTIICDKQIVYDSATNLLLNTFKFRSVKKAVAEKFRKTGQFSLKDVAEATAGVSGDYIPLPKLVRLLQHINILASISSGGKEVFFMPSALENATPQELSKWWDKSVLEQHSPAALFIRYKCGFVPIGVFPALIVRLAQECNIRHMIVDGIKKNLVQFRFGSDFNTITLVSQPKFYAIHISQQPTSKTPLHMVCTAVRDLIESSLKEVTLSMNYSFSAEHLQLAFECPRHRGREHLCLVESGHVQGVDSQDDLLTKELDWDSEGVDKDLNEIAYQMLDWESKLSSHMGLTPVDIHDIKAQYSDPVERRQEALRRWKNNQGIKLQATYGNLLQTFERAGHMRCVKAVQQVLAKKCATHGGFSDGGDGAVPHMMLCLENSDCPQPLEMEPRHLVWFGQPATTFNTT